MCKKITHPMISIILLASIVSLSCATIFKGPSADIRVNSNPAGADIYINGIDKGTTPQIMSLKRSQNYILTFKKEGYEDLNFEIEKKFDIATTVVGNIFSWALVGILVDVATGAAYSLTPADVEANLARLQQAGLIDTNLNLEQGEVFVFMVTKDEWNEIKASE